jgi:hypothetical protein
VLALLRRVGKSRRLWSTEGRGEGRGHAAYYKPPGGCSQDGCPTGVTLSRIWRQDVRSFEYPRRELPYYHRQDVWQPACFINGITNLIR